MTITSAKNQIRIAIDRGGTFTDCIGNPGTGKIEDDVFIKLLSVDPKNYPDAPLEGIRRLLEIFENRKIPRGTPLDVSRVSSIRMGTTLATNCALERNGEPCALVTTKGFKDVMVIGDQTRPDIFNLHIEKPRPLYDVVVEVDERVTLEDFTEDPNHHISEPSTGRKTVYGNSGEVVRILKTPDVSEVTRLLQSVYQRGSVADAYLTPVIKKYLQSIQAGLVNTENTNIQFMQSDGGLVEGHRFSGLKSILSGPAGGVVGYSRTCYNDNNRIPLIGFDMGGTSTDVSRFGEGKLEHVFETTTAGIVIQSPQLNVNTVAAGGSSRLFWENGLFRVGPDSATADPGPTAYRKGGPLTITDANLLLGRLVPEFFPKIFGPNEDESLDLEATERQFKELTETINKDLDVKMSPAEVAFWIF
ncbi:ANL_collapsed_G0053230.mRNA.1.CDS.1 [Saccharomyces cerevisiae]|nr:ANL_collapsed_G0053230.mRNA.1.CDS.1 [Saccharomyces cerevisiae]